jgi:hypothetical protein
MSDNLEPAPKMPRWEYEGEIVISGASGEFLDQENNV